MDHEEMTVDIEVFSEHLSSGRENLVSAEELDSFALTPGACSSNGHGCSSSSSKIDLE
jgi:hypothetical protein